VESAGGGLQFHANGGLSADFVWFSGQNQHRIIASPVRYGMPQVNFFSNGTTMSHLVQVYASGHSLALNHKWNKTCTLYKKAPGYQKAVQRCDDIWRTAPA